MFTQRQTTSLDLLLAQKFFAILNRVRNKGRDFYDVVFLLGRDVLPNYAYLEMKVGIRDAASLRARVLSHCGGMDMAAMAADVRPFLCQPGDARRLLLFANYFSYVPL